MTSKGLIANGVWVKPEQGESTQHLAQRLGVKSYDDLPPFDKLSDKHKYNLYVLQGCPFSHAARIAHTLKNLDNSIGVTYTAIESSEEVKGLCFDQTYPDNVFHKSALWELYLLNNNNNNSSSNNSNDNNSNNKKLTIRASAPLLVDVTDAIPVNNQSISLMKLFDKQNPEDKQLPQLIVNDPKFEELLNKIEKEINYQPYKSVFATTQQEYDQAVVTYFKALDYFEEILSKSRYIWSDKISGLDIRLFVTLIRWEFVYHHLFDLNMKSLKDFPNLFNFTKDLYQHPKIKPTTNIAQIRQHYYHDFQLKNPKRIIPVGPQTNLDEPHNRSRVY